MDGGIQSDWVDVRVQSGIDFFKMHTLHEYEYNINVTVSRCLRIL